MTVISGIYIISFLVYVVLGLVVLLRNHRAALNRYCWLFFACFALWAFEDILHNWHVTVPPGTIGPGVDYISSHLARLVGSIGSTGGYWFPTPLAFFALILTDHRAWLRRWYVVGPLLVVPALFTFVHWTGLGGLVLTPGLAGWVVDTEENMPWLYGYAGWYSLITLLVGILIARHGRRSSDPRIRKQSVAIAIGTLVSLVLGTISDIILPGTARFHGIPEMAGALGVAWAVGLTIGMTRYGLMAISVRTAADDILATMPDALLLLAPDGRVVQMNQAALDLLGYGRAELTGQPAERLFEKPKEFQVALSLVLDRHPVSRAEFNCRAGDGSLVPVAVAARAMVQRDGSVVGSVWVMRDVTQLRQAQLKEREAAAKYKDVVERANDGIVIVQDDVVRFVNTRMAEMGGHVPREVVGTRLSEHIHSDALPEVLERYRRRMAGDSPPAKYETVLRHRDGSKIPVELNAGIIAFQDRPADLVIVRDITDRRRAQEELQASRARYQAVFDLAPVGMAMTDIEGHWLMVNQLVADVLGYTLDELKGLSAGATYADSNSRRRVMELLSGPGRFDGLEVVMRHKDGSDRVVLMNGRRMELNGRTVFLASAVDITDRKRIQAELESSQRRFEQVVENAQEWIWETDAEGRYTYSSPLVRNVLGYEREEVEGKLHFFDLFHPEEREEMRARALDVFARKLPFRGFLNRNLHKQGRVVWFSTSAVPVLNPNGQLLGYRGVDTDVTQQKLAEAEIQANNRRLEALNEDLRREQAKLLRATEELKALNADLKRVSDEKSEFVAAASHELRTPLTTIIEGISLTEDATLGPVNADQKRYLRYAREDAEHLSELIGNLLDDARIEQGRMEVRRVKVDTRALVTQIQLSWETYLKDKDLRLTVDAPEGLLAYCDPSHYRRIVLNLLSNAVKFTPAGGQIVFRVVADPDGTIVTSVHDNGLGIPEAQQDRVFVRFRQITRSPSEPQAGTGLGLYLSRQLVLANGGQIWFKSREGQGTDFYFRLPAFGTQRTEEQG